MNTLNKILLGLLIAAVGLLMYQNFFESDNVISHDKEHSANTQSQTQLWTCGMHPEIISEEPGNCPICGMKLTPKKDSDQNSSNDGAVIIDPVTQQNMNLTTTVIDKRDFSTIITTNGILTVDESLEYVVTSRVDGWVEKLYINKTGQFVSKGQKLLEIYSPELISAQQEYLSALEYAETTKTSENEMLQSGGNDLVNNSRRKLELLNMSDEEINRLQHDGVVKTEITLYAQSSGTVMKKNVLEGEKISSSQPLIFITNLSSLWLLADVYESDLRSIERGAEADIIFSAYPDETIKGSVSFIYPTIAEHTRTTKIRIVIPNRSGKLKPEMIARVTIKGKKHGTHPAVPENAVINSGKKTLVIKQLEQGKFMPTLIETGVYSDGYYQVLSGLEEGDKIVTSAQFLIDSESNLQSAVDLLTSTKDTTEEEHAGHNHGTENEYGVESPLIRTGVIDVENIDENKDGKLFECPMDWNILADEYHRCPVCEMKMKEYSLPDIKKNLEKYGYEYKK